MEILRDRRIQKSECRDQNAELQMPREKGMAAAAKSESRMQILECRESANVSHEEVRCKMQHCKLPTVNLKLHAGGVAALVCIGLMMLAGSASAQPVGSGVGSKYYVWGQVNSPGAYSFVASPDIVELLSAGGGPTENANLRQVVLIRAVTQKRTRVDLQKLMSSGQVLRLTPGDVVIVPSSPWYNIRDWFTAITMTSTLVTLAITIVNWAGK